VTTAATTKASRPLQIEHNRIAAFAPPAAATSSRRLGSLAAAAPPAVVAAQRHADGLRRVNSIQRFPIVQMLVDLDAAAKRAASARGFRRRRRAAKDVVLA